ncbi:hypothetical protein BLA29_015112 [Euroglyphus maynei]|uniref:Uncharacterized protein n=1 Tax=Euroglyphus maynei TaxID=6958 RepID=A0A1Y3B3Q8_EURMA|nr:hypothetical protein BLA29_015112 [Euroglyphus maynei]
MDNKSDIMEYSGNQKKKCHVGYGQNLEMELPERVIDRARTTIHDLERIFQIFFFKDFHF